VKHPGTIILYLFTKYWCYKMAAGLVPGYFSFVNSVIVSVALNDEFTSPEIHLKFTSLSNLPTYITYSLIPWNRVFFEKLIVTHLVKKFPTFYGLRRLFTMFTRACHWSLP